MSKLLSDTIKELKLDPHSPYPWQILRDAEKRKQALDDIKNWRETQRLKLVQEECTNDDFEGDAA